MALTDYKASASLITSIGGKSVSEGMARSDVNDVIRTIGADMYAIMTRNGAPIEQYGGGTSASGSTNATALAAAWAAHDVVQLGRGNYNIDFSTTITLGENKILCGAGHEVTTITRTDTATGHAFLARDHGGNCGICDLAFVGNLQASVYLDGGFVSFDVTGAATESMRDIFVQRVKLSNIKGDGWIAVTQTGNYFINGVVFEDISVKGGDRRKTAGVDDLSKPGAIVWVQGHAAATSATGRVVNVRIARLTGDVPEVKGMLAVAAGVNGLLLDHPNFIRLGTNVASDKGGYAILVFNEVAGAPNPDNISIVEPTVQQGRSAGLYTANWGGSNRSRITYRQHDGSYIGGLVDTADVTLPKAAIAMTDSNTEIIVDGLRALQCWKAISIPLGAEQNVKLLSVTHESMKARAFPNPGANTGNGRFTLDPVAPVLSGYTGGVYKVTVTAGSGTATPTFTVKRPNGTTVGTYTIGGADFASEVGFKIASGTVNFVTGDEFHIDVQLIQPPDNGHSIQITRHVGLGAGGGAETSGFNSGPTGPILFGDIHIRNQSTGGMGVRFRTESAAGTLFTFGRTTFDGDLDIECLGDAISIWGENDADPIDPFVDGLFFAGTGRVKSHAGRGFMLRGTSSRVTFGGNYVADRGGRTTAAMTYAGFDGTNCQNLHIRSGALELSGWGTHASDTVAWDATGARGSIALGGISWGATANAYRASGMGTAKPTWTPSPNADGHVVANLTKAAPANFTDSGLDTVPTVITHWEYVNLTWYVIRSIAATT